MIQFYTQHIFALIFHTFILEAFLESIPQTHLTFIMLFVNQRLLLGEPYDNSRLFIFGFMSSVLSASLGMARLLMNGPSKLVKKQGNLGGYAQVGFALLMLLIMFVLVAKALWLAFSIIGGGHHPQPLNALVWIGVSLVPQLFLVSLSKLDQNYV